MPLRAIFRRAIEDGDVAVNPTDRLRLPAVRGTRDRIASPDEAAGLLSALRTPTERCGRQPCTRGFDVSSSWRCAGRTSTLPASWKNATAELRKRDQEAPALVPITLHECRHTFASLMIAASVNAKALGTYMGHSSVTITYDRYGHLMAGNEDEAAALLNAYLERANTKARLAEIS